MHRVGRTGRAGRNGEAISLIDIYEKYDMRDIEKLIGEKIPQEVVEGFEPDPTIRRKDVDEVKLKAEHKRASAKKERQYNKNTSNVPVTKKQMKATKKKRKTTKRDG